MRLAYFHLGFIDAAKASSHQVRETINSLNLNNCDITLFTNYLNKEQSPQFEGLKLVNLGMNNMGKLKVLALRMVISIKLKKIISSINHDVIFTRSAEVAIIAARLKRKVIYESHNSQPYKGSSLIAAYQIFLLKKYLNSKSNNLFLIVISAALQKFFLSKGFNKKKVLTYHDGFSEDKFKQTHSKSHYRKILNLPENKTIIAYTGSLKSDRGIERILALASELKDYLFLIVGGEMSQVAHYSSEAKDKNITNVSFKGMVKHDIIPSYLFASDILLAFWTYKVPTINYCSPLKLFEYMASGTLIIADGFNTINEVLENGKDAIVITPESHEQAAKAIKNAVKNDFYPRYSQNAKEKAYSLYTWDKRAKAILKFYKNQK